MDRLRMGDDQSPKVLVSNTGSNSLKFEVGCAAIAVFARGPRSDTIERSGARKGSPLRAFLIPTEEGMMIAHQAWLHYASRCHRLSSFNFPIPQTR